MDINGVPTPPDMPNYSSWDPIIFFGIPLLFFILILIVIRYLEHKKRLQNEGIHERS